MILGVQNEARIVVSSFALELESLFVGPAQAENLRIFCVRDDEPQAKQIAIADYRIDVRLWLGKRIGVADALATLDDPARAVRTVVDPRVLR